MNACRKIIALILLATLSMSCSRPTRIVLFNNLESDITILADDTSISIAPHTSKMFRFPGNMMQMTIQTESDSREYTVRFPPREYCEPVAAAVIHLQLESDWRIFVFPRDTPLPGDLQQSQPVGFPLTPTPREQLNLPNHGLESTGAPPAAGTPETHP